MLPLAQDGHGDSLYHAGRGLDEGRPASAIVAAQREAAPRRAGELRALPGWQAAIRAALGLWSPSMACFVMGTSSISVVGLVHTMAVDLKVSKPDVAALIMLFALAFALAAPLLQVAAGSLPRRTLLAIKASAL